MMKRVLMATVLGFMATGLLFAILMPPLLRRGIDPPHWLILSLFALGAIGPGLLAYRR